VSATETVEANKAVVRRLVEEAWNGNRPDLLDELCWPDIVEHLPRFGTTEGLSEPRRTAELFRAAFPDLRVVTHDLFGERDLVAARGTLHGTQARELFGVAPMGRSVAIDGVLMARLRGGKIAELWLHYDAEALVRQLRGEEPPLGFS
jgi:predicted ester cyclase